MKYLLLSLLIAISFTSKAQTYKPKDLKEKPKLRALITDKETREKHYALITKIGKAFFVFKDSVYIKLDMKKYTITDTIPYNPNN